jgi:hypothetical protein
VEGLSLGPPINSYITKGPKVSARLAGLRGPVGWRIAGFRRAAGPAAIDVIIKQGDGQQGGEGAPEEGAEEPVSDEKGSRGEDGRQNGLEDDWEKEEEGQEEDEEDEEGEEEGSADGGDDVSKRGDCEGALFTLPKVSGPAAAHT